jgi:glycosyltransferase involved in cell wall biosynthesis
MGSLPKISFVIPLHNRAEMVLEALQSLKEQTISEWEAIVVDDHSTDNPERTVVGFDPRVRLVSLPDARGRGSSCARNYGNLIAQAELIAVLDSDDLALPERAERAIISYNAYHWDFYCARRELRGEMKGALTAQKVLPEVWDSELFKTQSYVTHSSVVYTRKAALQIPYNSALPALSDYDMITRFIESGKKMFLDPIVTTVYRRHEGETITTDVDQALRVKLLHAIRTWRGWEEEDSHPEE